MALEKILPIGPNVFNYSNDFLRSFQDLNNLDFEKGSKVDLELKKENKNRKLNPILKVAGVEHAKIITELIKEVYQGTYPYKEMEDESEVRKMIESGKTIFILFKNKEDEIIGSTAFVLDFKAKRGNMRTWVVKKEYHGRFELTRSLIGCCVVIWTLYQEDILLWYGEVRTAHAKTQYILDLCSLKAVAIFPNKDVFYNRVESDILQVSYNKKALTIYRCKKIPKFLPGIEKIFKHSSKLYNLGIYKLVNPELNLDFSKIDKIKEKFSKRVIKDKYGYGSITFSIENSNSYFKFLYTPSVRNFEKAKYKVDNLEELFVFAQEYLSSLEELDARYCELFVSAYEPSHQKVFLELGLTPRGYVPSWKYNKKEGCFEDCIVFNYYKGKIKNDRLNLLKRNKELFQVLGFNLN